MRRPSEESIRTEFCDGPLLEQGEEKAIAANNSGQGGSAVGIEVSDRAELIERLKRGESPTWVRSREVSQ